jgi:nitrate reductase gamma subunit
MTLTIPDLYDFLRGPGFVISIFVFLSGFLYRTLWIIRATRKIQKSSINSENYVSSASSIAKGSLLKKIIPVLKIKLRNTIFRSNPVMGIISLIFHFLIFITPVFLSAHNIIADLTIGLSLPEIPERITDIFTLMLIAIGGFFLARRLFIPHVRMISTVRDYFILILVMTPFISGFSAHHHFFNYRIVIFMHMIIGEIAIMALPFTSLVHMPFIIFSRFYIDSEHSIIPGNRSW